MAPKKSGDLKPVENNIHEFMKGFWKENPILVTVLGLCPTLAVTTSAINGLTMGLAVVFVLTCSSLIVSVVRDFVPKQVRIACFVVIIATFVTMVDLFLKAFLLDLSKALGPFIPLIVVNCIILGRAEAFEDKVAGLVRYLKSSSPAPGFSEVLVPGEIESRLEAERGAAGVFVDDGTWREIENLARELDVAL